LAISAVNSMLKTPGEGTNLVVFSCWFCEASLFCFGVYCFQKFEDFFAFFCFLFVGNCVAAGADCVYCYAFVFVVENREKAAARRSVSANLAASFFWVVENAVSLMVSECGVTFRVEADKKVSVIAFLF
jgi:hypothetical protein